MIEHKKPLTIVYDDKQDLLTIEGITYDGGMFRHYGNPAFASKPGFWYRVESNKDGVLIITRAYPEIVAEDLKKLEAGAIVQNEDKGAKHD